MVDFSANESHLLPAKNKSLIIIIKEILINIDTIVGFRFGGVIIIIYI